MVSLLLRSFHVVLVLLLWSSVHRLSAAVIIIEIMANFILAAVVVAVVALVVRWEACHILTMRTAAICQLPMLSHIKLSKNCLHYFRSYINIENNNDTVLLRLGALTAIDGVVVADAVIVVFVTSTRSGSSS